MSPQGDTGQPREERWGEFTTTQWGVVTAAGQRDTAVASAALEVLCRGYWYPLYAHIRHRGYSPEDAQDLTQAFFAQLLERRSFSDLDRSKGRFRAFLLASLNYFLADQYDRQTAKKRGGGRQVISFDAERAEGRYRLEPVDNQSPDRLFERRWALALLDRVLQRLEHEYMGAGKGDWFGQLRPFLVEGARVRPYADVAADLGQTGEAVKKSVQRLRERCCQLFREEIAQTLADPAEVDDELRYLHAIMAR